MESTDRWQQPYRDAVEELDRRERQWKHTEELLRRIAGRLCIAARGIDPALDRALGDVIAQLRRPAEPAPLEGLLGQLTESVAALDRPVAAREPPPASLAAADAPRVRQSLGRLLDALQEQPELRPRAQALAERLAAATRIEALAEIATAIADLAQAQVGQLQQARDQADRLLAQFNERLAEIARHLRDEGEEQRSAAEDQRTFGQHLLDETEALAQHARQAGDLASLQDQVYRRLTVIDQRVRDYRSRAETRAVAYRERTEALYERIDSLETQTRALTRSVGKLERQVSTDALTRVPNRAAYDKRIVAELAAFKRDHRPRSLVAIDIDHFKRINDTYGHQAGDKVLQLVAQHWMRRLRDTDFFARYGGEEFAMLLDGVAAAPALVITDRLRESIGKLGFHFRREPVTITVSCGITAFRDGDSAQSLFERADRALYEAKRNGRNRCCVEV